MCCLVSTRRSHTGHRHRQHRRRPNTHRCTVPYYSVGVGVGVGVARFLCARSTPCTFFGVARGRRCEGAKGKKRKDAGEGLHARCVEEKTNVFLLRKPTHVHTRAHTLAHLDRTHLHPRQQRASMHVETLAHSCVTRTPTPRGHTHSRAPSRGNTYRHTDAHMAARPPHAPPRPYTPKLHHTRTHPPGTCARDTGGNEPKRPTTRATAPCPHVCKHTMRRKNTPAWLSRTVSPGRMLTYDAVRATAGWCGNVGLSRSAL